MVLRPARLRMDRPAPDGRGCVGCLGGARCLAARAVVVPGAVRHSQRPRMGAVCARGRPALAAASRGAGVVEPLRAERGPVRRAVGARRVRWRRAVAWGCCGWAVVSGQLMLLGPPKPDDVLTEHHYLGPTRGDVYQDEAGVIVSRQPPASRQLPQSWVELARWCIVSPASNAGSSQWARWVEWALETYPEATTVVSYSDPAAGHDGALYRACNWLWAPTWHRLRPPPSGGGSWDGETRQEVKDRWVFPLRSDPERAAALAVKDAAVLRRMPWAQYVEPSWKHRRGRMRPSGGGGDYRRWRSERRDIS